MQWLGYSYLIRSLEFKVPDLSLELATGKKQEIKPYGSKTQVKFLPKEIKADLYLHLETAINHQGIRLIYLVPIFNQIKSIELTQFIKQRPKEKHPKFKNMPKKI